MKTEYKKSERTDPLDKKEKVQKSNDRHIDQDFEGYPHTPASENIIRPDNDEDAIAAGLKNGENIAQNTEEIKETERNEQEETASDGSANAFERTEGIDNGNHDTLKIDEKGKVY